MGKTNSTAKCIANQARFWRNKIYKSANAAGKAMKMDPKTIRQIEDGEAVRLTTIQKYAELLSIPLDAILSDEDLASLEHNRIVLDYGNEDLFRGTDLGRVGSYSQNMAPARALGQPCNSVKFVSLFSEMASEPIEWAPLSGGPVIKPIWKIDESITPDEGLLAILENLQDAISKSVMSRTSDLSSIISQLKAQNAFKELFEELDKQFGAHILGCIVKTHVISESPYEDFFVNWGTDVCLPYFVIASNQVRELDLRYRKSLSEEDFNFQLDQLHPEDRAELLREVNDEIPY